MKSRFDVFIACTAGVVIALDAVAGILVVIDDCAALIGILLWTVTAALFVALVLLLALIRRFLAPVGAHALRLVIITAIATAVPAGLASLQHYTHMGRCIS